MTSVAYHSASASARNWFGRAEDWLDARGRGAWIAAMVLGYIFFWPVGLALTFYMAFTGRFGCRKAARRGFTMGSSGNSAFDAYKADTLARLEAEQRNFESFLERLREAKDKAEFDQFMEERARKAKAADRDDEEADEDPAPEGGKA